MQEISFVWFDLDDTVWDFRENSRRAQRQLYSMFGIDRYCPDVKIWIDTYEKHNHALWNQYNFGEISRQYLMDQRFIRPLAELGVPTNEIQALYGKLSTEYLECLGRQKALVPGAVEAVNKARSLGYGTGILSNGFREIQYRKLESSAISDLFDIIVLSEEIEVNKPDVRIYRYAEQKAGVSADGSMMVGDNPQTDIAGAVAAGWKAVYLNRDGNDADVPDGVRVISDIRDWYK